MAVNKDDLIIRAQFDNSGLKAGIKEAIKDVSTLSKTVTTVLISALTSAGKSLASVFSGKSLSDFFDKISGSAKKAGKDVDNLALESLPSLRYALYDVANTSRTFYDSIVGAGTAVVKFGADYESAFTDVERTTLSSSQLLESIKNQLLQLSQQIPLTFGDLSAIAALGAQLGVATGDLAGFAKTISQFSATTNVSIETAAQSFGALGELLNVSADQYANFGSAVAFVGVQSVATESEILAVATGIGGVANSAGLSAEYVIGLAGALASLRIPAEQSRGALTRIFQEVNRSAAGTGVDMQMFADILGTTSEEAKRLAENDMGSFFKKFVDGLSGLDTGELTTTLDNLNLADIRVTNVITRLSRNTNVLNSTLDDSGKAFKDGTFLSQAYALRVEDLASKFLLLQNSFQNLLAKLGGALEPILKPIVDFLRSFVNDFNAALSSDSGQIFTRIAAGAAAVIAALTGLITVIATVTASLFALQFAIKNLGWTAATGGFKGLAASLFGVGVAAEGATRGVKLLRLALISTGIGAALALIGSLAAAFMEAGNSASGMFNKIVSDTSGLTDALAADTAAYQAAVASGNTTLANSFAAVAYSGTSLNEQYGETAEKVYQVSQVIGSDLPNAYDYASDAIQQSTRYIGDNTVAWMKNALIQSEAFQNMAGKSGVADLFGAIGFDFAEGARLAATGGEDAVNEYFKTLANAALKDGRITLDKIKEVDTTLAYELLGSNEELSKLPAGGIGQWILNLYTGAVKTFPILADWINGFANMFGFDLSNVTGDTSLALAGLAEEASLMEMALGDAGTTGQDSMDDIGTSAGGAGKKLRLLTDYASDLSSTFARAFDIKFSGQSTLDAITSSFQEIADSTDEATQKISELSADLDSLTADKALQEYFLSVANAYGDTLAAAQIQAKINKINNQLTSTNQDLADAQDDANKTLVGNSSAAIENRSTILGLVQTYQAHIEALAASGMGQDELAAKSLQLKQDFLAQATALGYNSNELGIYASAFDDVKTIIDQVPRNVDVEFNGDAALTALEEFTRKAAEAGKSAGGAFSSGFDEGAADPPAPEFPGITPYYVAGYNYGGTLTQGQLAAMREKNPLIKAETQTLTTDATAAWQKSARDSVTAVETATVGVSNAYAGWQQSGSTAATNSVSPWTINLSKVPSLVQTNKPNFTPWSAAASTAAVNSANSWQATANNIPTQVRNKKSDMQVAFENLGSAAKVGWNLFAASAGSTLSNLFKWGYADGGYTGSGGKYEPAGIVHKGEYVVPKSEVNQVTKVPYFMEAKPHFANGGFVSGASSQAMGGMVSLSPEDRALLRSVGGSGEIILYANNEAIARSSNAGNRAIVATGGLP